MPIYTRSRQSCRVQAEIPLILDVQISRASSIFSANVSALSVRCEFTGTSPNTSLQPSLKTGIQRLLMMSGTQKFGLPQVRSAAKDTFHLIYKTRVKARQ
jgi:hypothetical protein